MPDDEEHPEPDRVADTYFRCELTEAQILRLVEADAARRSSRRRLPSRPGPTSSRWVTPGGLPLELARW